MSSREAFLSRVRQAVKDGNRAGDATTLPERGTVGYQGAGADPLATYVERAAMMNLRPVVVRSRDELFAKIEAILAAKNARKILVGGGAVMGDLDLNQWIASTGREVIVAKGAAKESLFAAEAAITGVTSLVAETGSLVVAAGMELTRTESLLPPVHIAVARADQIEPDLFDVCEEYSAANPPPANLVFITGPSKTGDIEMKLVTGVHGPGEVHVLILNTER